MTPHNGSSAPLAAAIRNALADEPIPAAAPAWSPCAADLTLEET